MACCLVSDARGVLQLSTAGRRSGKTTRSRSSSLFLNFTRCLLLRSFPNLSLPVATSHRGSMIASLFHCRGLPSIDTRYWYRPVVYVIIDSSQSGASQHSVPNLPMRGACSQPPPWVLDLGGVGQTLNLGSLRQTALKICPLNSLESLSFSAPQWW